MAETMPVVSGTFQTLPAMPFHALFNGLCFKVSLASSLLSALCGPIYSDCRSLLFALSIVRGVRGGGLRRLPGRDGEHRRPRPSRLLKNKVARSVGPSEAKAGTENKALIAAVNRCAT